MVDGTGSLNSVGESVESVIDRLAKTGKISLDEIETAL